MKKVIIGIVIAIVLVVVLIIVAPFIWLSITQKSIKSTTPATTSASYSQWQTFENSQYNIKLKYPSDWKYNVNSSPSNSHYLFIVTFTPNTGNKLQDSANAIALRVSNKGSVTNIDDWITKNTRPAAVKGGTEDSNGESIWVPTQLNKQTIGKQLVVNYVSETPWLGKNMVGSLILNKNYVFDFVQMENMATGIKEKIIESLE